MEVWSNWWGADGNVGPLPFAGGYAQQPAALMDALNHMSGIARRLMQKPGA